MRTTQQSNILLVEDEALISLSEAQMLENNGYSVKTVFTGEESIAAVKDDKEIDLILMDIDLGKGIDGTEAAKSILEIRSLPIIFLTSHSEKEMVGKVRNITRYGYVLKNSGDFVLLSSINMAFELFDVHQRLEESRAKFRYMFNHSKSGIAVLEPIEDGEDFLIKNLNKAAEAMDNVKKSAVIGKRITEAYPNVKDFGIFSVLQDVWKTGEAQENSKAFYQDKERQGWRTSFVYKLPSNAIVSVYNDETETQTLQRRVVREEKLFSGIIENANDGIVLTDEEGKILVWNPAQESITGKHSDEVIGKYLDEIQTQLAPPERKNKRTVSSYKEMMRNFFRTGNAPWLNKPLVNKIQREDGSIRFVESIIFTIGTEKSFRTCSIMRDITEREHQAEMLRQNEEKYRQLVENLEEGIGIVNNNEEILFVNPAFSRICGYAKEDLIGKKITEFITEDNQDKIKKETETRKQGKSSTYETEIIRKDGENRFLRVHAAPYRSDKAKIEGTLGLVQDVTEQRQKQTLIEKYVRILAKQKDESNALQKASLAVLEQTDFKHTAQTIFELAKNQTGAASGYVALLTDDGNENKVLFLDSGGMKCTVNPELPMPIRGLRELSYSQKRVVVDNDFMNSDWVGFMPEGHMRLNNVLFSPLPIKNQIVGIIGLANKPTGFTAEDEKITARFGEIAAIALKNSRILEELKVSEERFDLVSQATKDGIWDWNIETGEVFYSAGYTAMLGYTQEEFSNLIETWKASLHPDDAEQVLQVNNGCINGETDTFEVEYRLKQKNGNYMWVLGRGIAAKRGSSGKATRMIGTHVDINQNKEDQKKIEQLLKEKDMLLKEVHHRVKNNMFIISSLLSLQSNIIVNPSAKEALKEADSRVKSMQKVYQQLYNSDSYQSIELSRYINDLLVNIKETYQNHKINIKSKSKKLEIGVKDAVPLGIIVNELVTNAVKYAFPRQKEGTIEVNLSSEEKTAYQLIVSDNGIGIPSNIDLEHPKSFGLSIVTALVTQLDATIQVSTNNGTTVQITIPMNR
ncbi:MAG: PAS domain S-box protein [Spirochaetia bacterium]